MEKNYSTCSHLTLGILVTQLGQLKLLAVGNSASSLDEPFPPEQAIFLNAEIVERDKNAARAALISSLPILCACCTVNRRPRELAPTLKALYARCQ